MMTETELIETYDRARAAGMDDAAVLTLCFNRLRQELQRRISAAGDETVSDVLDAADQAWRGFAAERGMPLEFFADALRDRYPDVYVLWDRAGVEGGSGDER